MTRDTRLIRAGLLTSAASLFFATPALAQSAEQGNIEAAQEAPAEPATAAADDEGQDTATADIVVTARRTEERLQDVPASISAFNERTLDRLQATDTTGLQGAVPNLNIVQGRGSSNATNIYIRGIGQPDALQTFDPGVGVYVDDVYLSRIRGNQLDLLDVERVEVLRGPQGTLYGKNTIGGAIKFVSRRPGDEFRANGSVAIGSYNQFELKGAASGPVTDTLSAGFSVLRSRRDGYVEDELSDREYNDKDTIAARAALAFTPVSTVRLDLTADYARDDASLTIGDPLNNLVSAFGLVLPVSGLGERYDWTGRATPDLPNVTKLRHWGFAGTAAVDITDGLTLKSITAQRKLQTFDYIDIDATEYDVGDVLVDVDQKQFSQEFQLAYNSDRLKAVAGLYYLKENVESHQESFASDFLRTSLTVPPLSFLRTIDDDLVTKSYAAYANASFEVIPTVNVSGGIRFTREKKDYERTTSRFFGGVKADTFPFEANDTWKDTSPMVSVDWQVTPQAMVYARFAKGFKSGGFNGRANSPGEATAYEPEISKSYEAGFKTTIANQLRLNGAVFTSNLRDFQARVSDIDEDPVLGVPGPRLSVLNAGKLRIRGAELEAAWTPTPALLIDGQLGYLDAEYKEFVDLRFPGGSRAFQTPAFSPKWTLRLGAQYAAALGGGGSITIGGQSRYRSETVLSVDSTLVTAANVGTTTEIEGFFQQPYWLHDARIVWENPTKQFAVGLYGNNLTNKRYKTDAQEFSTVGNIRTVYYGAPRTVTLRLTARY